MKIALLTDGIYPYVIGGMQKHSFYLAKYLAKQQVFVDLYHTNQSQFDINKLEFFTEDEKRYITSIVIEFPSKGKLPGHYIRTSFQYSKRIFELFKLNSKVDFVYAKGFTAWKLLKEKKKGFPCAPIGVNFHGYEMFQKAPNFKSYLQQIFVFRKPVLYHIKQADYLFSYGGRITELIRKFTINDNKIIEIPTGIEEEWVNYSNKKVHEPLKFIFVGRYERRKGIQELTEVLNKLSGNYSFKFSFIGPVPLKEQIKSNKVDYYGSITNSNTIKNLLLESDVLVCPSHSEGMPNVIIEALACGLAIIASDVGAINQMVQIDNGILIQPGNSHELQSALIRVMEMDFLTLEQLKVKSVEKVTTHFLWDTIIIETIEKIQAKLLKLK